MSMHNPFKLYEKIQPNFNPDAEELWVFCLSHQLELLGLEMVHRGSAAECPAVPRDIFRMAIRTNSSSVVIAHNHTSGEIVPSAADLKITKQLCWIGMLLELPVIDHLIFTSSNFASLASLGLIDRFTIRGKKSLHKSLASTGI